MNNNDKKIWMDGLLVDWNKATIHVLTHALHYATAVFEGIRCYKTVNGLAVFRLSDHIQRLMNSGKIYFMDIRYSKEQLQRAVIDTINANKVGDESYIRPIAYYGYGKMGVNPLPNKVSVAIAMWEWNEYLKEKQYKEKGIRLMVSAWMRIDGRTMPFLAKATANYANSALARIEALKAGFDEAIMLNTNGKVIEAGAENIFIVKESLLITPPTSSGALEGITRDTVLAIAKENGIQYEIRDISRDELYTADEVFLTGTAAGIKPVAEIDNRSIADGKEGRITRQLKERFELVVYGEDDSISKKWLTYVE
ncbi:MAG: branched-chain amino acid transaminase [Thermoproteota archaeon]|jgi:branched-chain amino acid aminotransferase|nr:branched-chain amino acid transaminase [Thermoproteota archaeon]